MDLVGLEKDRFNLEKMVFKFEDTVEFREFWIKYCDKYRKID